MALGRSRGVFDCNFCDWLVVISSWRLVDVAWGVFAMDATRVLSVCGDSVASTQSGARPKGIASNRLAMAGNFYLGFESHWIFLSKIPHYSKLDECLLFPPIETLKQVLGMARRLSSAEACETGSLWALFFHFWRQFGGGSYTWFKVSFIYYSFNFYHMKSSEYWAIILID